MDCSAAISRGTGNIIGDMSGLINCLVAIFSIAARYLSAGLRCRRRIAVVSMRLMSGATGTGNGLFLARSESIDDDVDRHALSVIGIDKGGPYDGI